MENAFANDVLAFFRSQDSHVRLGILEFYLIGPPVEDVLALEPKKTLGFRCVLGSRGGAGNVLSVEKERIRVVRASSPPNGQTF